MGRRGVMAASPIEHVVVLMMENQSFAPNALPALLTLATSFTVCTNWFSSVPGPTGPNRLFANCASSGGYAGAAYENMPSQLASLPSVFAKLDMAGFTWQIYHQDQEFATELGLD